MASPHVAAIAALIIASRKLGDHPDPELVQAHIQATARDLGRPGFDSRYGWGLVDAARALRCPPLTPC
jgi:serine protease